MKEQENSQNKKTKKGEKTTFASAFYDLVETLLISTAAVILIFTLFIRLSVVNGPSMMNTLFHEDVLIISDIAFEPRYGDIIVAQKIESAWPTPIVKRVIATEGQTVDIDFDTWTVTVDGEVIDESDYIYLAKDAVLTANISFPVKVPDGQLFVMGDNRNHSSDSRDYRIGFIDERCVFGRVLCRIAPLNTFEIFERLK